MPGKELSARGMRAEPPELPRNVPRGQIRCLSHRAAPKSGNRGLGMDTDTCPHLSRWLGSSREGTTKIPSRPSALPTNPQIQCQIPAPGGHQRQEQGLGVVPRLGFPHQQENIHREEDKGAAPGENPEPRSLPGSWRRSKPFFFYEGFITFGLRAPRKIPCLEKPLDSCPELGNIITRNCKQSHEEK